MLAISGEKIYNILLEISKANTELGVTIGESLKGAATMGASTSTGALVGGLLGGPVGMIAGGAIGFFGGASYTAANTKPFKPLMDVISEMSEKDKRKLVSIARDILKREGIDLARDIVGSYGSRIARYLLLEVMKEMEIAVERKKSMN